MSCEKIYVPEKPLTIIEITAMEPKLASYAYLYKLDDKNGHVFYLTEASSFDAQPKRTLGDTIK